MTTNFALSLSVEGIELLHRVSRGWRRIGCADVASDTLDADLSEMREKAEAMAPEGLRTKLIIPLDQIKYTAIDSTRTSMDDIHAVLDGATPYALNELVIDCERFGGRTHIAAVASETLKEAEAFAHGHGFNPVSFVAIPEPFTFQREVFFGPSEMMPKLLGPNGKVAADQLPVMIVGTRIKSRLLVFDLPDDVTAQAEREDLAYVFAAKIDAAEGAKAQEPQVEELVAPESAPDDTLTSPPEPAATPAAQPNWTDRIVAEYYPPVIKPEIIAPKVPLIPEAPVFAVLPLFDPVIVEFHATARKTTKAPLVAPAKHGGVIAPKIGAAVPAANRTTAPAAPQNRTLLLAAGFAACAVLLGGLVWSQIEQTVPVETVVAATPVETVATPLREVGPDVDEPSLVAAVNSIFAEPDFASNTSEGSPLPTIAFDTPVTMMPRPTTVVAVAADDAPVAVQPAPSPPEQQTAQATVGAPVLRGMVLSPDEAERIYAATGVWQRAPRFFDVPAGVIPLEFSPPIETFAPDRVAQPDVPLLEGLESDLSFIAPADPPSPDIEFPRDADGFILATPEGTVTPEGAVVIAGLPDLTITPRPELSQADLDRMALVAPAPEGVVVIAGRPAVIPPLRPEDAALPETEAVVADTPAQTDAPATTPTPGGVGLAGLELRDSGAVGLDTRMIESAAADDLRPQLRPQRLNIATVENDTPDITSIIAGIEAEDATLRFDNSTNLAVSASLRPAPRPANFSSVVASARVAPQQTQTAAAAAVQAPVQAPVEAAAPVAPQNYAPVPGGVARAATQEGVIRLRDINLIGVYGRPNARRALVRLSNGRYVRVEVGSALDGGQVTAIGDTALNYVKRGRTYAIELPAG